MKFRYSYILILFITLSQNSFAMEKQIVITSDLQYGYAQKLFGTKDFETAIIEFKRFIHFFPESERVEQARFNIGVCLFNLKKFHGAARAFNEIIINGKENNITKQACFFQSKAFINTGNTGYAQIVLQNYLKLAEDRETKDRIYFNLAKIHLADVRKGKAGSLVLAREYLLKISKSGAIKYHT
ncbi:MAG: tetratricopeptide repeat protein, partial [Desulfobacula sp.]|nr:tetratricopeptide repeat protein [Desulfobacula sp.]